MNLKPHPQGRTFFVCIAIVASMFTAGCGDDAPEKSSNTEGDVGFDLGREDVAVDATGCECSPPLVCSDDDECVCPSSESLCQQAGAVCGMVDGETLCPGAGELDCGSCASGSECIDGACVCTAEDDAAFCTRVGAACGDVTTADNCGVERTVDCGSCAAAGAFCSAAHQCVCTPEDDAEFCTRVGAGCGAITDIDNCGVSRTVSTCGSCSGAFDVCAANVCTCIPESDAEFCAARNAECGGVAGDDRCTTARAVANCGICQSSGFQCSAANRCECTPESDAQFCSRLGAECGSKAGLDNCGQPRSVTTCGTCAGAGSTCSANVCACASETDAQFCARLNAECGPTAGVDACGAARVVQCGICGGTGESCTAANQCVCVAESDAQFCTRLGGNCGLASGNDNCGDPRIDVNCGVCTGTGEVCSNNQCSCTPDTDAVLCARNGAQCGQPVVVDNCGSARTLNCGICPGPGDVCNGSNRCVCTPQGDVAFCADRGASCGRVSGPDNCGDPRFDVLCGTCSGVGQTCTGNQCVCPNETDAEFCARFGVACGFFSNIDTCGNARTANCGGCPNTGDICSMNSCSCTPEADIDFCVRVGAECGVKGDFDNCGQPRFNVNCGSCALASDECVSNACVPCQPELDADFCARLGADCGSLTATDNCGVSRTAMCGSACSGTDSCISNTCCTPDDAATVCASAGATCGAVTTADNCGQLRTIANCGNCTGGDVCFLNACCVSETDAQFCASRAGCGNVTDFDNCGQSRTANCGMCGGPESCTFGTCVVDFTSNPNPNPLISSTTPVSNSVSVTGCTTVVGVLVSVDILHTWIGDLVVQVQSPSGTTVILHNRTGSSLDDILGTYGGDLIPAESLSAFDGEPGDGLWTITITDAVSLDDGAFDEWTLHLACL